MTRLDQKRIQRAIWWIGFTCGALVFGSIGFFFGAEVHGCKPVPAIATTNTGGQS